MVEIIKISYYLIILFVVIIMLYLLIYVKYFNLSITEEKKAFNNYIKNYKYQNINKSYNLSDENECLISYKI
jgi:hypothetical protein